MPQEQMKVDCRRKDRTAPLVGMEALPDEVLEHVLSFLPVREAVHTYVLARRWRYLWRSIPALRIIWDTEHDWLDEEDVEHMNIFVDHLMLHSNHDMRLDFCEIRINVFNIEGPEPHVYSWIQQALLSQFRILIVEDTSLDTGFSLPGTPIISKHLATLKLGSVELRDKFLDFRAAQLWRVYGCAIAEFTLKRYHLNRFNT